MRSLIHETAIIYPGVVVEPNVRVGAYSVIGGPPESRDFFPMERKLSVPLVILREGSRIFEFVSIHAGTTRATVIGRFSAVFNHSHVAHDCILEENVIVGGHASLAGFVHAMPHATICGRANIHQKCVLGPYSLLAPQSFLKTHIPPGQRFIGRPARPAGFNDIGFEKNKVSKDWVEWRYNLEFERLKEESGWDG